jgi:hypothetical protein
MTARSMLPDKLPSKVRHSSPSCQHQSPRSVRPGTAGARLAPPVIVGIVPPADLVRVSCRPCPPRLGT